MEVTLNDQIKVYFDAEKHAYYVSENNGEYVEVPSVTTVLKTLNKPALLYWVGNEAADYIRRNLSPGQYVDEMDIEELAAGASRAFMHGQKRAAFVGSMVHNWIERYWKNLANGIGVPKLPYNEQAQKGVKAFLAWVEEHQVKPIAVERIVVGYGVIDRKIRPAYAGTTDLIAEIDGVPTVLDVKTSKAVYDEYLLQLGAYTYAISDTMGLLVNRGMILRVDKSTGKFEVHPYALGDLTDAGQAFLSLLQVHYWLNGKKGR